MSWFAKEVEGTAWETIPEPRLGSAGTIYAERQKLKEQVGDLLGK